MSIFSFDRALVDTPGGEPEYDHQATYDQLMAYMETGHHGLARDLLDEYAIEYPSRSESLRLSLVRLYGTGL